MEDNETGVPKSNPSEPMERVRVPEKWRGPDVVIEDDDGEYD